MDPIIQLSLRVEREANDQVQRRIPEPQPYWDKPQNSKAAPKPERGNWLKRLFGMPHNQQPCADC
jgi:hypothetical protein